MDSFDMELYRLAGYSTGLPQGALQPADCDSVTEIAHINNIAGYCCVFNWASMRYTFISESIKKILGYDRGIFLEKGLNFSLSIIHSADMQKLRAIHLAIFNYYYITPAEQRPQLRFSYNFRVRTATNSYVHILRQSKFNGFTDEGQPTLEYVNSTDITGFNNNPAIMLVVHRLSAAGTYVLCYEREFLEPNPLLSVREKQVLELARQGLTSKAIACKLYLSMETIKSHRKNIIAKTGAGNMTAAINKVSFKPVY